jgi:fucose 4-O-acetylase-like acetyltransferase
MLIIVHISMLSAAVSCLCAGVGFALFGRKKKFWLKWHKKLNLTGFFLLVAGAGAAFANIAASDGNHLAGLHPWTGLAAFLLSGITLFLGFYAVQAAGRASARALHKWLGRISLFAAGIALVFGLFMIGIF